MVANCDVNIQCKKIVAVRKKKIIYLAHPTEHQKETKKLQKLLESMGFYVINPFDHDEHARELTDLWHKNPKLRTNIEYSRMIVEKDLGGINSCNILVANALKPSIGTSMEIFYANMAGKRVYILTKTVSPWYLYHGTVIDSTEKLLEMLKNE